jgi:hypothetical protein
MGVLLEKGFPLTFKSFVRTFLLYLEDTFYLSMNHPLRKEERYYV